ncbi:MAG: glutathione ABC transporter permease GsiC [Bdellovibrionaceae bacterium]|nr:glutathione ABC transporter permease GsiC [Pseudobdellovibrionaceae bacterium]
MFSFILRRILISIPVALGVSTLCFMLIHFVPGDPVDIILGESANVIEKSALRSELGLDQPMLTQYGNFISGLLQGDLGRSIQSRRPVFEEIAERIPATLELTLGAMCLAVLIGIPLGIFAALKQYSGTDNVVMVFGLLGMSMPGFWLGPMLILIFSIQLDWFPVSERGGLEHLVLPAFSLAIALSAIIMRMTRTSMLEVIKEDYIRTAKSKGLAGGKIYFKHALRNALMPIITIIGLQFGALLTGTVITETIFDWPGIGTLFFSAIQERNYPLVQACILTVSLTYVAVNLLVDIAYAAVNPQVRLK